jgi:hypothetical protein
MVVLLDTYPRKLEAITSRPHDIEIMSLSPLLFDECSNSTQPYLIQLSSLEASHASIRLCKHSRNESHLSVREDPKAATMLFDFVKSPFSS